MTATTPTWRSDHPQIVAPHGGSVVEWLVEDGDQVSPGHSLLRQHPEATT